MPSQVKLEMDKAGDVLCLVQEQYEMQILSSPSRSKAGSWR